MGPSNSAPKAISFVTVLLMSATVKDRSDEYSFCTTFSLKKLGSGTADFRWWKLMKPSTIGFESIECISQVDSTS